MNLRTSLNDALPHEEEQLPSAALRKMEEHLAQQYATSSNLALQIVIKHARMILRNAWLVEFVMAMGTWFFVDKNGNYVDRKDTKLYPDLIAFDDFMCRWDDYFKITGQPVRFTADGPLVTDW